MHIAIAGKAGSGKSTAAKWLRDTHGYTIRSIAAKIKEICALHKAVVDGGADAIAALEAHIADVLPDDVEMVMPAVRDAFARTPIVEGKPRRLLQVVGTDIIRAVQHDVWVDYLIRSVAKDGRVVVDDVRFRNEWEAFDAAGWLTVYCAAPPSIRDKRLTADYGKPLSDAEKHHPSECDLDRLSPDDWGYILNTAGSMASERAQVDEMMAEVLADGPSDD